ncbi:PUA-like domain-containing protein [Pisolithus marmoratus]|nr:PUA-like domain-containing protein [Pisolithus marmoratus]
MASSYAEEREANIRRNRQLLVDLGVERLVPTQEPREKQRVKAKRTATQIDQEDEVDQRPQKLVRTEARRRSHRLASHALMEAQQRESPLPVKDSSGVSSGSNKQRTRNPKVYGHISGIEVGKWWASRQECSEDAVHAPWVGGIAPGEKGAYSVAISGGYEDDIDDGYAFTYTGAGGRDLRGTKAAPKNLRTAPHSFDQTFEHNHNRALKRSVETGKPVRVIRGYKLQSKYGPSEGYRYDGLYVVKKCWTERGLGKGGHLVCKFAFVRLEGQSPIPVNPDKEG